MTASVALGQGDDRLVGIWVADEGYRTVELLFRSDGHYQVESTTLGSEFGPSVDRGHYETVGPSLRMTSYQYFEKPAAIAYEFQIDGDSLSLTGGSELSLMFQLKDSCRNNFHVTSAKSTNARTPKSQR